MTFFSGNLKDNLGNLGKTVSEKAEVVAKKTGEVVEVVAKKTGETIEVQKIKSQIRVMQRNNTRDFQNIGKMIYERFQDGEELDDELMELCETIQERKEEIEECKEQIATIKGLDVCVCCRAHIDPDSVYCPKCGEKVDEE